MKSNLAGLNVFLVEDDFLIQLDLKMTLERAGAMVTTASSVKEGLELSGQAFSAAVLDIRLGDGFVFPVAERLAAANVPLIFHSGNIETDEVGSKFPRAVALHKPVHESVLVETVKAQASAAEM